MNLTDIMEGIADLIPGLAYPFPVDAVSVPCAVVGYPVDLEYDLTPSSHKVVLPVWRVVGGSGIEARDAISDALADQGSVKDAIDGAHLWGDVRVTEAHVEQVSIGAIAYPAIRFDCEVIT